jgi:RimJ/RimL family protein N-acetyltransferase
MSHGRLLEGAGQDVAREATELYGRWVLLRPVEPTDHSRLAAMMSGGAAGVRYRYRGVTPGPRQFESDLWSNVLAQFVICRPDGDTPIGLVSAFNASLHDGHAHISVCVDPDVRGRGWPLEAAGLFIEYLFQCFELRKLYAQVSELNRRRFRPALGDLLVEEARLADFDFFNGEYFDSVIYAIWRHRWFDPTNRHRRLLFARRAAPEPVAA